EFPDGIAVRRHIILTQVDLMEHSVCLRGIWVSCKMALQSSDGRIEFALFHLNGGLNDGRSRGPANFGLNGFIRLGYQAGITQAERREGAEGETADVGPMRRARIFSKERPGKYFGEQPERKQPVRGGFKT